MLYVDAELQRLIDHMEQSGVLENTIVVLTSDHGELFERGIVGHTTESFFNPVIHIPLFIIEPGRNSRQDIYQPTSAADILPTALKLTGNSAPAYTDGIILPPYNPNHVPIERSVYGVHGRYNPPRKPLTTASVMLVKWPYKLVAYWGYDKLQGAPMYELFNLADDPEELENLHQKAPHVLNAMRDEIYDQINQADKPYQ